MTTDTAVAVTKRVVEDRGMFQHITINSSVTASLTCFQVELNDIPYNVRHLYLKDDYQWPLLINVLQDFPFLSFGPKEGAEMPFRVYKFSSLIK